jgi:diaminohydroxyphosphoribosylaminopyrimidine deaminase / 5-amino-6-(5-phosphoribosylamino)uracil reductase
MNEPPQARAPAFSADDERFMALALSLGRRGLGNTWPNPAVGAIIVKNGIIVGRGWTQPGGRPHAETEAIRRAKRAAQGATLYVTLEPCSHHGQTPPCVESLIKAGITRVVAPIDDPNPNVGGQGYRRLREAGIQVDEGLAADQATRAHVGHIARICHGRPHVLLKLAVSADDKVGLAGRKQVSITSNAGREHVFQMRAMSDAILVGIGTVLSDNPQLNCRLPGLIERSPVRVILDSRLRAPLSSAVFAALQDVPTWVFASARASQIAEEILVQKGCKVFRVSEHNGKLDLQELLGILAGEGITRLLVEGGPIVAASFAAADLADEAMIVRGDKMLGADAIDALEGMPLVRLTERFKRHSSDKIGSDTFESYERD